MTRKFYFYFISIILIFTSCSRKINPNEGYEQIKSKNSVDLFEANNSIAKEIKVNADFKDKLSLDDSILYYNDSIKSNYKNFTFDLKADKKYKIKVSSLCNCAGLKKYIFIPKIATGNVNSRINLELDSTYFNYEKGPLTLNKVWSLKSNGLTENTTMEFLLFSDNEKLSENVFKFIVTSFGAIPVNIKSTLVGNFIIEIEEH
ncbi:hypothetical protein SAMN04487764_2724 [Gillisia sp. Hel1_33_143]|uniref:hypothetical protein n=1 Tax=unclassified Gillisia TaxID=2615025 RepID=UPI00054EB0D2|nr:MULTISPECIES: hypothetical protein [unclassified Gillisia]SDS26742.1 hypothetical protein SAMN04487764_1825 [Gillisia sp. Hel1_33_143]SDS65345.1 hypothetical protein SAMN04487764_2724 [Gillisia sp. Hel1_33_143]